MLTSECSLLSPKGALASVKDDLVKEYCSSRANVLRNYLEIRMAKGAEEFYGSVKRIKEVPPAYYRTSSMGDSFHFFAIFKCFLMRHTLSDLTLPTLRSLKSVRMCLIIHQRLINFLLGIQNERPILDNLLVQR